MSESTRFFGFLNQRARAGASGKGKGDGDTLPSQLMRVPKNGTLPDLSKAPCTTCLWPHLFQVSGLLNSQSLNFNATINAILDMGLKLADARRGFLVLFDDNARPRLQINRHFDERALQSTAARASRSVLEKVLKAGKPLQIDDVQGDQVLANADSLVDFAVSAVVCVPLTIHSAEDQARASRIDLPARNGIIGALYVDRINTTTPFPPRTLEVFESLASLATTAIINAKLFQSLEQNQQRGRALDYARQIADTLLPANRPNSPNGWAVAAKLNVSDEIGGDFYDFIDLPNHATVVVVGDASGHGVGPALVMATARASFRQLVRKANTVEDVSMAVAKLNHVLKDDTTSKMFLTLCVALLEPNGKVTLFNAGHEPALVYRAPRSGSSGGANYLTLPGTALGIAKRLKYPPHPIDNCATGDALLLTSDGVRETRDAGGKEQFGRDRLREAFARFAPMPDATDCLDGIEKVVRQFKAGSPEDDQTLVVIKRR